MGTAILRPKQLYGPSGKFPVGHTTFWSQIALRDESDPFIPGTKVRRLRMAKLGPRTTIAYEDEADAIVEALRAERDAMPVKPKPSKVT